MKEFPIEMIKRENAHGINSENIQDYLFQRWPMLLIDKIVDYEPGEWAIGLHAVSRNELFFLGHYPDNPIMPGSMILEGLTQTAEIILSSAGIISSSKGGVLFAGADKLRFYRPVRPGDIIKYYCILEDDRFGVYKISGTGKVNDEICISGAMSFVPIKE